MLKNKTRKTLMAKRLRFCKTFASKIIGLMFARKIQDEALVFVFDKDQGDAIHMLFVFFSIDLLFLDKNKKVIEIKENFKPFTVYVPKKEYRYFVELAAGTKKKTKTGIGDELAF